MKILFVNNARYDLVGVQTAVNKLADLIGIVIIRRALKSRSTIVGERKI